jgi:hypothetical protein
MQIASSDLKRLSALLDDALDLEPDEREQWLCGLAPRI